MSEDFKENVKLTKAEKEKETQAKAAQELQTSWPLPSNVSDMKSFAIGALTFRDVIAIGGCELIPIAICFIFLGNVNQVLALIIGALIGIGPAIISIKHVFTGDLPIEDKIRIQLAERGDTNLLNWDKSFKDGEYVPTSTQSFVPSLVFESSNDFVFLPGDKGGFAVIELSVDDITQSRPTDLLGTVNSFKRMLDSLVRDSDCIPIQIMLKSEPINLGGFVDKAVQRQNEIYLEEKFVAAARAEDYAALLSDLDERDAFYYRYYVVVTYREDAEEVGNSTMNSTSVRRMRLKEKGMNPLAKRAKAAQDADFEIGEDRKAKLKQLQTSADFGMIRTREALRRRVDMVKLALSDLGSQHASVRPRTLNRTELAKLIFQCYNDTDKNTIDAVLEQALDEKLTMFSIPMYNDYPDLFTYRKHAEPAVKKLEAHKAGALTTQRRG